MSTPQEKQPCWIEVRRKIDLPASSIISEMIYDATARELEIAFHAQEGRDRRIYLYHNVPEGVIREMISSKSIGSYFRQHIRDKFETEELT